MDHLMKSYMAIMADRDAAIRERNIALVEKRKALADRDIAIMQRDTVVSERNTVVMERDDAIYQLHYHSSSLSCNNLPPHNLSINGMPQLETEAAYDPRSDTLPNSEITSESVKKSKKFKKTKEKKVGPTKKSTKPPRESKKIITKNLRDSLSLELSNIEGAANCVPVCSCTGNLQPCYKWGNGGWQSACCTNNISMFPLPQLDNKRHSRIGGRKMSGNVYAKLISRLASEGHDLSSPVDLKDHWARHGTNRYITIR